VKERLRKGFKPIYLGVKISQRECAREARERGRDGGGERKRRRLEFVVVIALPSQPRAQNADCQP
jgi:hypothetical protein